MKILLKQSALYKKRLPGFSLPELLVVLVIIGILVLIALPQSHAIDIESQEYRSTTATRIPAHAAKK